jgi:hypothetical protein
MQFPATKANRTEEAPTRGVRLKLRGVRIAAYPEFLPSR